MHPKTHSFKLLHIYVALIIAILIIPKDSHSQTYTTLVDGNWSNTTNVWSLDGVTPCGCMPPNPTNGVDISIEHNLNLGFDLDITGGSLVDLQPYTSSLVGTGSTITVTGATFIINSDLDIQGMDILSAATVNVYGYVSIQTNNSMDIYGTLNVLGGYFEANSSITVQPTGAMILTNYSKIVSNASFSNEGYIFICGVCCVEISGSVTNENTGTIAGTGGWNTVSGTTKNFGSWDPAMLWCSAGNDVGMPSAETCPETETLCNAIILSVTFGSFDVALQSEHALLSWSTVSERNNDYFSVERAKDNFNFTQIGVVDGSGTTDLEQLYSLADQLYEEGKYYYRLKQVDFDGKYEYSNVISVKYAVDDRDIVGTYNLLGQSIEDANFKGLVIDYYRDGSTKKRYQH